ncbi:unnamed protein product [Caenorhabditis brenneri]
MHPPCIICLEDSNILTQGICSKCFMFFRRVVNEKRMRRCVSPCEEKRVGSPSFCRYCRLQKILDAGIIIEDHITWNEKILDSRYWKTLGKKLEGITNDSQFFVLLLLQRYQRELHQNYNTSLVGDDEVGVVKINQKTYRCAKPSDVNLTLHIGFRNAIDFANQFPSFRNLGIERKRLIFAEFGIAYLLIDQAFKTARMTDDAFWFLQNGTFLHPSCFFGITNGVSPVQYDAPTQARYHCEFVNGLLNEIKTPFSNLEIDAMECVFLKTLLLFAPSFIQRVNVEESKEIVSRCLMRLMECTIKKSPIDGMVRYGEIVMLIGSIRCAIKSFYNQTTVSNVFHQSNFDLFVRGSFPT